MDKLQRQCLNMLRRWPNGLAAGRLMSALNVKNREDIYLALTELELGGQVTLRRNDGGLITHATITDAGNAAFVNQAIARTAAPFSDQLGEMGRAIAELQRAVAELQDAAPEQRKGIVARINEWSGIVANGASVAQAVVQWAQQVSH